jgi:hypothetical protein
MHQPRQLPTVADLHGNPITHHDLPPERTRWTANKKAIVVRAVEAGLLTLDEALERYSMSPEEFEYWVIGLAEYGPVGLQVTYTHRRV